MMGINTRGTFCVTQACLPHLKKSSHAHVLNNSPPLNMSPIWFQNHVAYTMAKYGMSMCVLGMAEELKDQKIGKNKKYLNVIPRYPFGGPFPPPY